MREKESLEVKIHRDYSLYQYGNGLSLMKKAIAAGDQDLRITLLTCLLIVCIECLHGNFTMAGVQVSNGIALLREWRKGYLNAREYPIGFSSPAPHVIEDSLVQMLGGLEIQGISLDKDTSQDVQQTGMGERQSGIVNIPTQFQSLEESRIYLEVLIRRSKEWFLSIGAYNKALPEIASSAIPSIQITSPNINTPPTLPSRTHHPNDSSITTQQSQHLQDLHNWKTSFKTLTKNHAPISTHPNPSLKHQLLVYKCIFLALNTSGIGNFTQYPDEITEILNLAKGVEDFDEVGNETRFMIYQRFRGAREGVGLGCRVGGGRWIGRELGRLLEGMERGVRDVVVDWVLGFEEEEVRDGEVLGCEGFGGGAVSEVGKREREREGSIVCEYEVMEG